MLKTFHSITILPVESIIAFCYADERAEHQRSAVLLKSRMNARKEIYEAFHYIHNIYKQLFLRQIKSILFVHHDYYFINHKNNS